MYDTDYEFKTQEKSIIFRPFVKQLKEVPFRGRLSEEATKLKQELEHIV